MGVFAVDFRGRARNRWGLLVSNRASFEGRRDEGEGQGAGVVQIGVDGGGNVGNGVIGNRRLKVSCVRAIGMDRVQATSENYDVRGTGDEFGSWFGLNLLYR
jgi:hypothetical protein